MGGEGRRSGRRTATGAVAAVGAYLTKHAGVPVERAARIVAETPRFRDPEYYVRLGRIAAPDVLVAYLPPESAMKLLRRRQLAHGQTLHTTLSSFMSVCSCVAAAGSEGRPAFSFGCGDAREYGGLADGGLIVALPAAVVHRLMQNAPTHDARGPSARAGARSSVDTSVEITTSSRAGVRSRADVTPRARDKKA